MSLKKFTAAGIGWLLLIAIVVGGQSIGGADGIMNTVGSGSGGGATPGNAIPGFINLDSALNPQLGKCISNVTSGAAKCTLLLSGDSTTWGEGSGTGGAGSGNVNLTSYPTQFANLLNASGIPAHQDGFCGAVAIGGDSRISFSGGWANGGFYNTIGGASYSNSTDTATFSFSPINPVNTFKITWNTQFNGQGGTATYNIDGGATSTFNTQAANARGTATSTITAAAPGTHVLNIARNGTGTQVSVACIEAWNSTVPSISVVNAGWVGGAIANWVDNSSPGAPLPSIVRYAADVVGMNIGINDETQNGGLGDLTAFVPNYQTFITALYSPPFTGVTNATVVGGNTITFSTAVPSTLAAGMIAYDLSAAMPPGAGFAGNFVVSSTSNSVTFNAAVSVLSGETIAFYAPTGLFLFVPTPISTIGFVPQSTQDAFTAAINTLGTSNSVTVINLAHQLVSWVQATVLGMQFDSLHPNAAGYGRVAGAAAQFIRMSP